MKLFSRTLIFLLINSISIVNGYADIPDAGLGVADEPLMPDQAFPLTTEVIGADMIRAQWDIADGYYLYRKKFKFTSDTSDIIFDVANYPKGKIKEDEFFGKVETYRGKLVIDIPIKRSKDTRKFDFTIVSQGCADIGICYPPQKKQLNLTLPELPTTLASVTSIEKQDSGSLNPLSALKKLGNSLGIGSTDNEFLLPDQAFVFSADVVSGNMLKASWNIEDGYYLYRDKFSFALQDVDGVTIGEINMPAGETKVDESFGKMEVYHNSVDINIPLIRTVFDPTKLTLKAKYQGCADAGLCYPPQTKLMPVSLPGGQTKPQISVSSNNSPTTPSSAIVSEQDLLADKIATGNVIVTMLVFFLAGLGLAFTPCVFPMVPILSSIIIGQGDKITTRKAFTMSLIYVLAMAITYTIAGVFAGLFGENLQAAFQNPWILGTFSAVFVALAFSMFGFYELQMPASIQSKLTEYSNKQEGGTLFGVAIMGFLSALIVGPCVAAPLAGALIYIGQTGDAVLGGLALFALSMGMGAPLIAIGTSAGKLLPKAGTWMDAVKAVFGVLMLAVAIWMLERIVPAFVSMILWATLLIVSAIYMGALEPFGEKKSGWVKLWKGIGVTALVYGVIIFVGVASGGKDVFQPLSNFGLAGNQTSGAGSHLAFKQIKGLKQLDDEIKNARSNGKMVMLDLYADWCISCKEMEKFTFSDPAVQSALKDIVLIQADVTLNDDQDKALLKKFGLVGPPSIMFFDKNGNEKRGFRLVGFLNAEKFASHVNRVKQ